MREFDERKKSRASIIIRGVKTSTDSLFVDATLNSRDITPINVYCIIRDSGMYRATILDNDISDSKKFKDISAYRQVYISKDLIYMYSTTRKEIKKRVEQKE